MKRSDMSKENHPRGLCPEERKEFSDILERVVELYVKMPGKTPRKVIIGCSEIYPDTCFMIFKGTEEEALNLRKVLG